MHEIKAVVRNGRIETDEPLDLPEGTELLIPLPNGAAAEADDWDNSPEGIATWLKWYDSLQPLIMTEKESAELEADRRLRKEWEKAQFESHAAKLQKEWE